MSECTVCGAEPEILYKCKSCGEPFCGDECGSAKDKLCLYCMDDEEEDYPAEEEYEEDDDG